MWKTNVPFSNAFAPTPVHEAKSVVVPAREQPVWSHVRSRTFAPAVAVSSFLLTLSVTFEPEAEPNVSETKMNLPLELNS